MRQRCIPPSAQVSSSGRRLLGSPSRPWTTTISGSADVARVGLPRRSRTGGAPRPGARGIGDAGVVGVSSVDRVRSTSVSVYRVVPGTASMSSVGPSTTGPAPGHAGVSVAPATDGRATAPTRGVPIANAMTTAATTPRRSAISRRDPRARTVRARARPRRCPRRSAVARARRASSSRGAGGTCRPSC